MADILYLDMCTRTYSSKYPKSKTVDDLVQEARSVGKSAKDVIDIIHNIRREEGTHAVSATEVRKRMYANP